VNYYPFHVGDYTSATQHLTLEEDAMYRRLLDICYTTEKPLPKEERQLFRLTRAASDLHREAVLTVLHEFFSETEQGWISTRVEAELEVMREKQQKQRDRANKRWHKPDANTGNATAMPRHEETIAAAQKPDAAAMPPTPTPTPTPKKNISSEPLPGSEPVTTFAIQLVDSTEYRISVKDFGEWEKAFPAVDVPQELREMRAWSMANPTKRKTRRGAAAFIVKWLAKAQDTPSHHRSNNRNGNPSTGELMAGAL